MPEYTAEQLANATPEEWNTILDDFDVGSDYEKYFQKFDQSEIDSIEKNFANQVAQIDLRHRSAIDSIGQQIQSKAVDLGHQTRTAQAQRGFEGAGDITARMTAQKGDLFGKGKQQMKTSAGERALSTEAAELGKEDATRSAYQTYSDQFYGALGTVEGLKDDPGGGSCFIAGTKVLMSDGSMKNIEDIKVGESVKGMSSDNVVLELDHTILANRRLYSINGGNYFVTAEHPFMTKDGWKSINPKATLKENHIAFSEEDSIGMLDVGDILITSGDEIEIESISLKSGDPQMPLYNFALSGDHTYSADGYLVHNKCCFIVLEVENREKLDVYVRKYRDEMLDDNNRKGYYKLAQVVVPLMRKYKLLKWIFKYSFVNPAKSWARTYYTGKGMGWVFEPLRKFWLGIFNYLGKDHEMKIDNG